MRRVTRLHLVALALVLASAAPTAFANGVAQNAKLRVALADLPTVVRVGQTMRGTLSLQNLTAEFQHADIQFALRTPLGNGLIRSSTRDLAPNFSKTVRSVFTVSSDARPGAYELVVTVTNGGQTLTVVHNFTVQ